MSGYPDGDLPRIIGLEEFLTDAEEGFPPLAVHREDLGADANRIDEVVLRTVRKLL